MLTGGTASIMKTRVRCAVVFEFRTLGTDETVLTDTSERSYSIFADTIIHTGVGFTVVGVCFAGITFEPVTAFTGVCVDVIDALAVVLTWVWKAVVHVDVASQS